MGARNVIVTQREVLELHARIYEGDANVRQILVATNVKKRNVLPNHPMHSRMHAGPLHAFPHWCLNVQRPLIM